MCVVCYFSSLYLTIKEVACIGSSYYKQILSIKHLLIFHLLLHFGDYQCMGLSFQEMRHFVSVKEKINMVSILSNSSSVK